MTDKKLGMLIALGTFFMLYFLDYLLNTDILSPFIFRKDGFSISIVGIILLFVLSLLVAYIVQSIRRRKK